ncbi:shikimate dehydrogenase family protein [Sphingomonas glaciei]|uniref:Shikimate dehydrogenase n=1 Tax=Sphingomonas glaciei TaxID=2938948 RepID=A0ABY5MV41_9SPHN|nr:shikimate dehydrogenase [Sphingomonas glaciei]UUR07294.1 shikimate dehydrogenase [Sphingomonas glaciei]
MIGDPVSHSKSPLIHRFWLGKLGLTYDYGTTRVSADQLPAYLERRRADPLWAGCNVTMPLKVEALAHLAEVSPEVRSVGATNTITRVGEDARLRGHNTDLLGVREPLQAWLKGEDFFTASVIGTGGAAAAATVALLQGPAPSTLVSYGRTYDSAIAFRRRFDPVDAEHLSAPISDLSRAGKAGDHPSLLVNASPLGMRGQPPLVVDLSEMAPGSIVFDMVYDPVETDLIRQARDCGLVALDGLIMLVAQAAAAFELLFCEPAPREHDAELRELLTA